MRRSLTQISGCEPEEKWLEVVSVSLPLPHKLSAPTWELHESSHRWVFFWNTVRLQEILVCFSKVLAHTLIFLSWVALEFRKCLEEKTGPVLAFQTHGSIKYSMISFAPVTSLCLDLTHILSLFLCLSLADAFRKTVADP